MGKLKKGILAAVAVVVGIVTLKKFRGGNDEADEEVVE
ncbi:MULTISPECIES: DLW-39 family protein [Halobacteriales]